MFEHADLIGWTLAVLAIGYAVWTDRRAGKRLDISRTLALSLLSLASRARTGTRSLPRSMTFFEN